MANLPATPKAGRVAKAEPVHHKVTVEPDLKAGHVPPMPEAGCAVKAEHVHRRVKKAERAHPMPEAVHAAKADHVHHRERVAVVQKAGHARLMRKELHAVKADPAHPGATVGYAPAVEAIAVRPRAAPRIGKHLLMRIPAPLKRAGKTRKCRAPIWSMACMR